MGVFSKVSLLKEKVFVFNAKPFSRTPSLLLMRGPWPLMQAQQK